MCKLNYNKIITKYKLIINYYTNMYTNLICCATCAQLRECIVIRNAQCFFSACSPLGIASDRPDFGCDLVEPCHNPTVIGIRSDHSRNPRRSLSPAAVMSRPRSGRFQHRSDRDRTAQAPAEVQAVAIVRTTNGGRRRRHGRQRDESRTGAHKSITQHIISQHV